MPVEFLCPGCEKKITCSEDKIGQPGKCPKCGTKFQVPDPNEPDEDEEQTAKEKETEKEAEAERDEVNWEDIILDGFSTGGARAEYEEREA